MSDSNVVSLFNREPKKVSEDTETKSETEEVSFEESMKRNKAKKDKLAAERLAANKSVLRSYRIKN